MVKLANDIMTMLLSKINPYQYHPSFNTSNRNPFPISHLQGTLHWRFLRGGGNVPPWKKNYDVNLARVPPVPLGWVAALAAGSCTWGNAAARFSARTLREGWFRRAHPLTNCWVVVQDPVRTWFLCCDSSYRVKTPAYKSCQMSFFF
jgi:hypothetical protein